MRLANIVLFPLFISILLFGQGKVCNAQVKWAKNPFDHKVFIQNNGQFDKSVPGRGKVLYGAQVGDIMLYFTEKGITYCHARLQEKNKDKDPDAEPQQKIIMDYLSGEWEGANPQVNIEPTDELNYYYTYPKGKNSTIKTNIYQRIKYNNIYPGIDIEYEFPKDKEGIKYSIIVHPGADISLVKLKYSREDALDFRTDGCVIFNSKMGEFTDHAPVSYYSGETNKIETTYKINGTTESFELKEYDKTKTLIVDPWTTNPLFTNIDRAFDLDWDNNGNVYASGGRSNPAYQLVKMDSTGAIQWTFNATSINSSIYYGDFTTDKATGTCYIGEGARSLGAQALKVGSNGSLLATFPGDSHIGEMWRMEFDPRHHNIVIGGGSQGQADQAAILDTDMVTLTYANIFSTTSSNVDMVVLALDPEKEHAYLATSIIVYGTPQPALANQLVQVPIPALTPNAYMVPDGYNFYEASSVLYTHTNAMNGAAVSLKWFYMYNGDTLKKFGRNTGALQATFPVRLNNPYRYGGLDVDKCDDVFIGVQDSIRIVDSTLTYVTSIKLPDTVYDLHLGQGNILYACGAGFVSQLVNPVLSPDILHVNGTNTNCTCNGSATANFTPACSPGPFYYKWSNSATTQTITGLCAGVYTVTIVDSSSVPPALDTASVRITNTSGFTVSMTDSNPVCSKRGNITANPSGGTPPYTYAWSNGETNQVDTGLIAGIYTCTITDQNGCTATISATLTSLGNGPVITVCCDGSITVGDSVNLSATGASSFSWAPINGLSCSLCSDPVAKPIINTTYCASADSLGCVSRVCVSINLETSCGSIFVPNAFSPNGDNVDDIEYVYGGCIQALEFKVYDRWGNMVFETTDPSKGWDGKYNGQPMNSGVYDYTLVALQLSGKATDQKGSITLIR
jgi:gliding motility-associated-like protein